MYRLTLADPNGIVLGTWWIITKRPSMDANEYNITKAWGRIALMDEVHTAVTVHENAEGGKS